MLRLIPEPLGITKKMKTEITKYYDNLALKYDKNRFDNSYGNYIDIQENTILKKYLNKDDITRNLDIACGTGRFLKYADYGIDISKEMVSVSKKKFPKKHIVIGDIEHLPYENTFFKNVLSFHLFMHLEFQQLKGIFKEVSKVVEKNGLFIFDLPSKKRRTITKYKATSWHGGNQISLKELKELTADNWELVSFHGVGFFPIHLIPKRIRKYVISLDNILSNTMFRELSSHIVYVLKKK